MDGTMERCGSGNGASDGARVVHELSLKVQEYLWQQVGNSLKVKLEAGSYEQTCVLFEQLYREKYKALKVTNDDVYEDIKRLSRPAFISGGFPYVALCCAAILEQRRQLNLIDKLSVAVTKVFSTLHWILLEAHQTGIQVELDFPSIELFVQTIIPNINNLYERDLTFSLQVGLALWQPLWDHSPPLTSLLAKPIINLPPDNAMLSVNGPTPHRPVMTYFDVALLKVMMLKNWHFNGYRWGLRYIQKHLEQVLNYHGFTTENSEVLDLLRQFNNSGRRGSNVSAAHSTVMSSESYNEVSANTNHQHNTPLAPQKSNLPPELRPFATDEGEINFSFVVKIIKKLLTTANLVKMSGEMLFIIAQLIDLSIHSYTKQHIKFEFEGLLICLLNTIKLLGCDQCSTVLRGTKSDHLRSLAQIYLKKLLAHKEETARAVITDYVESVDLSNAVVFFHSFMGYCTSNSAKKEAKKPGVGYQDSFEIDPNTTTNYTSYLDNKGTNERLILKWTSNLLIRKFVGEWNRMKTLGRTDLFASVVQLVKYLQQQHHLVFRKIVMHGLLDSFDKSRNSRSLKSPQQDAAALANLSPPGSPSLHTMSMDGTGSINRFKAVITKNKVVKTFQAPFQAIKTAMKTDQQNESTPTGAGPSAAGSSSTLPHNMFSSSSMQRSDSTSSLDSTTTSTVLSSNTTTTAPTKKEGHMTLPRSLMRTFAPSSTPTLRDVVDKLGGKSSFDSPHLSESRAGTVRGKMVNCNGLYSGLRQLRCVLQVATPGIAPEEAVVAAMLDLEAPVVARAAYLLELAYFVHRCNKNDWPSLVQFTPTYGGTSDDPDAPMLKHQAGLLFRKWGIAVGEKLEDILMQEKVQYENNKSALVFDEKSLEFMYQGDIKSVSQDCPHALRHVACQLLFEITAFLRETYVQMAEQRSTPVESPNMSAKHPTLTPQKSDGTGRKKTSVASVIRKISVMPRRKVSTSHLLPTSASNSTSDQPYSPGKARKKASNAVRNRVQRKTSEIHMRPHQHHRRSSKSTASLAGMEREASVTVTDAEVEDEFAWLGIIIKMNKATDLLCTHSPCMASCPIAQMRSCNALMDALNTVYASHIEDDVPGHPCRYPSPERPNQMNDEVGRYLNEKVVSLPHVPYSVLCKGARVMDVNQLHDTMAFSWEVLRYPDDKIKAAATSLFLISGVLHLQMESTTSDFVMKQLTSVDAGDRARAVERLGTLWNYQYSVYDHLEENDKRFLKIALPKVEFTVPSRPVGIDPQIAPDAPWIPNAQNFQDVDLSDDEDDFYFMDSEKQLEAKTKKRAKKLNELKENYLVSAEPFAFQAVQKLNIFNNTGTGGEEDNSNTTYLKMKEEATTIHWDCPVQSFFPESMEEGLLQCVRLLDDTTITTVNSHTVAGLARQLIWKCMVDNPEIFFRRFLEKITTKQHQTELIILLRKLLTHFPTLPPHTGRYLFNNLVGVVSHYHRTNRPNTQEKIAAIIPLFSLITPSMTKIYFKELQMSLRREHVEDILMMTANGACVKEIVVYPERDTFPGLDNMTFGHLLKDIGERVDVENMWLVDKHSKQIMEPDYRIRDVYTHKRGFPRPALQLERFNETAAFRKRERQALIHKLINISQLEFCTSVFDALPNKRHVMFLYTELYQKKSFPQMAIENDFELCEDYTSLGREISGMDVIYKNSWVNFIPTMLKGLSETLSFYGEEMINIFIDPINGALLLYCEDVLILRSALAALINIVICYEKMFSLHGFSEILPTLLHLYSQYEGNQLVKEAIEFTIYQFFYIHGGSFILQLFGSVAPILIPDTDPIMKAEDQEDMVPAKNLFNLLESLDLQPHKQPYDPLDILSLVDKEIKPYGDPVNEESDRSSIDLSIRLALTIISYKSESKRALQMMYVLSTLIPYYLQHLKSKKEGATDVDVKKEMKNMRYLTKYVATIIELYEHLRNSIHDVTTPDHRGGGDETNSGDSHWLWNMMHSIVAHVSQWFSSHGREERPEGDDMEREPITEGENPIVISPADKDQRTKFDDFYLPRTILLTLASDFALNCTDTYNTLRQMSSEVGSTNTRNNGGFPDVIEDENSLILIDIAISMLKLNVVFRDHDVLKNPGLERFLLEAMPLINWKDNLEPFSVIIKRMTIIFKTIAETPDYWRYLDWDGLENLIKGLYLTLKKQERIADIPEIFDLIHIALKVMIGEVGGGESGVVAGVRSSSSISFNQTIVKLSARLLYTHPEKFDLRKNFASYLRQSEPLKVDRFLVHWLLPLAIRMGTGRFDYPRMTFENIEFISTSLIAILDPKERDEERDPVPFLARFAVLQCSPTETPTSLLNICFLGFKIMLTVYPTSFGKYWKQIKRTILNFMEKNPGEILLWKFLSFVVTTRSTLMVYLLPKIRQKLSVLDMFDEPVRDVMSRIRSDLARPPVLTSRSRILQQLLQELSLVAQKDKETIRRGFDEDDEDEEDGARTPSPPPPKRDRIRNNNIAVEDDIAYINLLNDKINANKQGDELSLERKPSGIMKQSGSSSLEQPLKKQVSFHGNSPLLSPMNQKNSTPSPSPRSRARRSALVDPTIGMQEGRAIPEEGEAQQQQQQQKDQQEQPVGATNLDTNSFKITNPLGRRHGDGGNFSSPDLELGHLSTPGNLAGNLNTSGSLSAPMATDKKRLASSRDRFRQKKSLPEVEDSGEEEEEKEEEEKVVGDEVSIVAATLGADEEGKDEEEGEYETLWNIKQHPPPHPHPHPPRALLELNTQPPQHSEESQSWQVQLQEADGEKSPIPRSPRRAHRSPLLRTGEGSRSPLRRTDGDMMRKDNAGNEEDADRDTRL